MRRIIKGFFLVVLVVAAAVALAMVLAADLLAGAAANGAPAVTSSRFSYGSWAGELGTEFDPGGPAGWSVVFVHGGGWTEGQATDTALGFAQSLAAATGWRVYAIDYPTAPVDGLPVRQVEPAAVNDAVHYVAGRASTDPAHIVVWGESAGGQLALLDAYRDARHAHPRVSAVVSIAGPADMRTTYSYDVPYDGGAMVAGYEGETLEAALANGDSRYADTSPDANTGRAVPPTYQAIAAADPVVPAAASEQLQTALEANGVANRLDEIPGSDHPPALEDDTVPATGRTVAQQAIAFLGTHYVSRAAPAAARCRHRVLLAAVLGLRRYPHCGRRLWTGVGGGQRERRAADRAAAGDR